MDLHNYKQLSLISPTSAVFGLCELLCGSSCESHKGHKRGKNTIKIKPNQLGGNDLLKQGLSKSLDQIYYNYTFSSVRKYHDRTGPNPQTSNNKPKIDVFLFLFLV